MRAAIVDDEALARSRLRRLLETLGPSLVTVVAECVNARDLLSTAANTTLDVVFLDIEMPGGDGFSALERWPGPRPHVVFVTGHAQYGARAFDQRASDFILKPVSIDRLRDTLERLRVSAAQERPSAQTLAPAVRIALPVGNRTRMVAVDEIDVVMARANYLEVHAAGSRYLIRSTLSSFHTRLEAAGFLRLHRSALVRVGAVREILSMGSGRFRLLLQGGQQVQTAKRYRSSIIALIDSAACE